MRAAITLMMVRLFFAELVVFTIVSLLGMAFAPRLLLLESHVVEAMKPLISSAFLLGAVAAGASILGALLSVRTSLEVAAQAPSQLEPRQVLEVASLPSRIVVGNALCAGMAAVVALFPPVRAPQTAMVTQVEIVVFGLVLVHVGVLLFYVWARRIVSRVIEDMPPVVVVDSLDYLARTPRGLRQISRRITAAVVGPVLLVTVASALLVHAHLRVFGDPRQVDSVVEVVRGALDDVGVSAAGQDAAAHAASRHGFEISLERTPLRFQEEVLALGARRAFVPLEVGHATVTVGPPTVGFATIWYGAVLVLAFALSVAIGRVVGDAHYRDILAASERLARIGVADVLRGGAVAAPAHFDAVEELGSAIDDLGAVFREFARAQRRAISGREAMSRTRTLLFASMSHDLKAPLNAVLGFSELLLRQPLSAGQRESVRIIAQRGRELLFLIETVLDTARLQAHELSPVPEAALPTEVFMRALAQARALLGDSIRILPEIEPGMPVSRIDGGRVEQALVALIVVTSRFAKDGTVYVRAESVEGRLVSAVETRASVDDAATLEKVFDVEVGPERMRKTGTLGLGPALARSLLELQGGSVVLHVKPDGLVRFEIDVPTDGAPHPPPSEGDMGH